MPPFENQFPRAVQLAQVIVQTRLRMGDLAVDATVGNGNDTLFLADQVGETGRVIGFDIQETAIRKTEEKVRGFDHVELICSGHEEMTQYLGEDSPRAVMFNLGYLPGSGKHVITRAETTLQALVGAAGVLQPRGVITVVLYTGHEGGPEEATAVRDWAKSLDQEIFSVVEYGFLNQKNSPPALIAIERKKAE